MGLIDDIKTQVKKAGSNKAKFIYFKSGSKIRLRMLDDMEGGTKVPFHDSFALGVNEPCQTLFGRSCSGCDNEDLRHRDQFMWSVWDYEANEVKLLLSPVNNFSPLPALVAMYDTYGTIVDRDYVITKTGSQQNSSFAVVPMDKVKFRNEKAKPFSKVKALQLLDKAFPSDSSTDDDEPPAKGNKNKPASKPAPADDDDLEEMSPKQLYALCKEKDLDVEPRKSESYYLEALRAAEAAEDDDDWGDEPAKVDYSAMSPKELYALCKERDLQVEPRKTAEYYAIKLEAADSGEDEPADDEW